MACWSTYGWGGQGRFSRRSLNTFSCCPLRCSGMFFLWSHGYLLIQVLDEVSSPRRPSMTPSSSTAHPSLTSLHKSPPQNPVLLSSRHCITICNYLGYLYVKVVCRLLTLECKLHKSWAPVYLRPTASPFLRTEPGPHSCWWGCRMANPYLKGIWPPQNVNACTLWSSNPTSGHLFYRCTCVITHAQKCTVTVFVLQ